MRKPELSLKERDTLQYIRNFCANHDYSPSLREMTEALGAGSTSVMTHRIRVLAQKGALTFSPGIARSVRLTHQERHHHVMEVIVIQPSPNGVTPEVVAQINRALKQDGIDRVEVHVISE